MRNVNLVVVLLFASLFIFPMHGHALNLMESFFLKVTVVENEVEHEWEYTSPGKYEYEIGNKVIKTKEAKEKMLSVIKTINLSEKSEVEDMVEAIKRELFPEIERLDIRWMNQESKLYTWVWDKNE